jgi:hypothetical protein
MGGRNAATSKTGVMFTAIDDMLLSPLNDKPILIGGKALEYYNLRKTGKDIDFVVTNADYQNLLKKYNRNDHFPPHTPGVTINKTDYFQNINGYDYNYFRPRASDAGKYLVASKEDLILLKAITGYDEIHDPPPPPSVRMKSFKDLQLLVDSLSHKK